VPPSARGSRVVSPALRNADSPTPSPSVVQSTGSHASIRLRMLSPESPSDETIREKLLGSHDGHEEYVDSEAPRASQEHQRRWRILAITSTSLLVISLVLNIFQFRTSLRRGVTRPYIYCKKHPLNRVIIEAKPVL
jgi:hypothetical protein